MVSVGKLLSWCVAMVMVLVVVMVTPSEGGFYGRGNIMRRKYPNGPSEYWNMMPKKYGGYEYIGQRTNPVGQRVDTVEQRADPVGQRFDTVEQRADPVGQRFDTVEQRADPVYPRFPTYPY